MFGVRIILALLNDLRNLQSFVNSLEQTKCHRSHWFLWKNLFIKPFGPVVLFEVGEEHEDRQLGQSVTFIWA